ncbi:LLM class flavin-dependent oxidoreductase [Mycolicibacterium thermoresistibile]
MTAYGHDLLFGTFVTPDNRPPHHPVEQAVVADRAGLDLVTFQDHPYVAKFHDTWTLMSYAAARTERVRLSANVVNLPLRPPAVLARAVAGLDLLSGGRIELGLGAGAFWDGVAAMGGQRRSPGESIEALEEAVAVIRGIWDVDAEGVLTVDGAHYQIRGAKRGPAPAHPVGIWIGGYQPRMLGVVGRLADGWLPSLQYLSGGVADLAAMNRRIDDAAAAADRDPRDIRRLLNIGPQPSAEELADIALGYGVSAFILASDDSVTTEWFAAEIAPAVRELVAKEC